MRHWYDHERELSAYYFAAVNCFGVPHQCTFRNCAELMWSKPPTQPGTTVQWQAVGPAERSFACRQCVRCRRPMRVSVTTMPHPAAHVGILTFSPPVDEASALESTFDTAAVSVSAVCTRGRKDLSELAIWGSGPVKTAGLE